MLFSSDEVVQDGKGRCHALWLFCAKLLSHFPSLLHSKWTKPLLTLIFQTSRSWCCVLGPFHLLSQTGVPKAEGSSSSWSLARAASPPNVLETSRWKTLARVTQTGPVLLQPTLITPCQKLPFSILNPARILDLLTSIEKLFQTFILWYRCPSNFQIMGFHR